MIMIFYTGSTRFFSLFLSFLLRQRWNVENDIPCVQEETMMIMIKAL